MASAMKGFCWSDTLVKVHERQFVVIPGSSLTTKTQSSQRFSWCS
jgi:hypothetical protein